ncbi:MAG TPA: GAF domain-containing protein [Kofleriaceae bacterium]
MSEATGDAETVRRELEALRAVHDATERRLRATHAVARVLAEETTIDGAMPRILGALGTSLGCALAGFWVPVAGELTAHATWAAAGPDAPWHAESRHYRFLIGTGIPGRVWRDRGPVWIADVSTETNLPRQKLMLGAEIRSGIGFPVVAGTEVVGVIELYRRDADAPADELVEVLRSIGAHLGQFLQNTRLLEQRSKMARASEQLSRSLDLEAVVGTLAQATVPWLGDFCAIHLAMPDFPPVVHHANPAKRPRTLNLQTKYRATPPIDVALKEGTIQFVPEVTEAALTSIAENRDHLDAMRALAFGSWVVVPIIARGVAVGALAVVTEGARRISPEDLGLIEELASRGALAVANASLYTEATATTRALEQERETMRQLDGIGRRLSGELDQAALVQAVTDCATELTGAQLGAFFHTMLDEQGDSQNLVSVSGLSRDAFQKLGLPRPADKSLVRIDDIAQDPRRPRPPGDAMLVRSYLTVPVVSRNGRSLGSLLFGHTEPAKFGEHAQRLAIAVAGHAAAALDNARLFGDAQRLIKELEKTNAELDLFAYAASHDLRAPLRGITNLATWIEEDLGTSVPKKVHEHIVMLKGRATRMDKLINGLLELARIGRARQRAERVDVTELLHETIDLIAPPESSRILIIGAMPTLVAERFGLQQVFLNLIGNAIQHSQRHDVVVRISAIERADEHEFTIADNGVGVAPEHHERIWQLFQTLQSRDVVETTGIGLALVRKQAEANGGEAWIDPQPANTPGATFRFTWPKKSR